MPRPNNKIIEAAEFDRARGESIEPWSPALEASGHDAT